MRPTDVQIWSSPFLTTTSCHTHISVKGCSIPSPHILYRPSTYLKTEVLQGPPLWPAMPCDCSDSPDSLTLSSVCTSAESPYLTRILAISCVSALLLMPWQRLPSSLSSLLNSPTWHIPDYPATTLDLTSPAAAQQYHRSTAIMPEQGLYD